MAEYRREIGIAVTFAVIAATGIGILALNAFPSSGTGTSDTGSIFTSYVDTETSTSFLASTSTQTAIIGSLPIVAVTGGVVTTAQQTQLACSSPQASGTTCLYIDGWALNYSNSTATIDFANQGPSTVTLNITFSGSAANMGFRGAVNLNSQSLPSSGSIQAITSPNLPNLQEGDQLNVTITGTTGVVFTSTITI